MKKQPVVVLLLSALCLWTPSLHAASKTATIRSEAFIKDILEMTVSQSSQSQLSFGNIAMSSTPKEIGPLRVTVKVTSNSGERYQVTELISGPLQDANNDQIAVENLKFKSASERSAGTGVSSPMTASNSSQTVFVSDGLGSSDTINVDYTLTTPADQPPGDYSMTLTYTTSAL